jgi:hypothetical protein
MKEPYSEGPASHADPESCTFAREGAREALTGACADRVLSLEKLLDWGADAVSTCGRQHQIRRHGKADQDPTWSETSDMHRNTSRENREIPCPPGDDGVAGRAGKSKDESQR